MSALPVSVASMAPSQRFPIKKVREKMITKEMTIEEILNQSPARGARLAQFLTELGLSCSSCESATWETLEAGMASHGFGEDEIDTVVEQLNELISAPLPPKDQITLTKQAASKVRELQKADKKEGWYLRLEERPGGCSGYSYHLDFAKEANPEKDQLFLSEGIEIAIPLSMVDHFLGTEIDYIDGLRGAGFKISNPNARSACGCGSSYNY